MYLYITYMYNKYNYLPICTMIYIITLRTSSWGFDLFLSPRIRLFFTVGFFFVPYDNLSSMQRDSWEKKKEQFQIGNCLAIKFMDFDGFGGRSERRGRGDDEDFCFLNIINDGLICLTRCPCCGYCW